MFICHFTLLTIHCLFYLAMTPSSIASYMNGVTKLGGVNFAKWKADIQMILAIMDQDHSFREDEPVEPIAEDANDTTLVLRKAEYEKAKVQWERSDRIAFMIMDNAIDPAIRGALPKTADNAKTFMAKIEEHFKGFSKDNASILMSKLMQAKYDGRGNVHEHVLKMIDMSNKMKDLECPLPEPYVVHYIMMSLSSCFGNFKINYNSSDKKWTTTELIVDLSQEEERLRAKNGGNLVNFAKGSSYGHGKSGGKFSHQKGKGKNPYDPPKEASKEDVANEKKCPKCMQCKKYGHIRRKCDEFKAWLAKKGNDFMSFIDESFFTNFSYNAWWIDSGATVHVTNSSQGLLDARTTGRERSLQVADGRETKVEAVRTLPLLLHGGSILYLNDILYVPSLRRNLISVASLEDDGYECLFGNNKCTIKFNDVIIGLAPRRGMLYMLSLNDFPVMNVCDVTNKRRRITTSDNETSLKLWHYRLGHILRGEWSVSLKKRYSRR
jgi:hypothetical protein